MVGTDTPTTARRLSSAARRATAAPKGEAAGGQGLAEGGDDVVVHVAAVEGVGVADGHAGRGSGGGKVEGSLQGEAVGGGDRDWFLDSGSHRRWDCIV